MVLLEKQMSHFLDSMRSSSKDSSTRFELEMNLKRFHNHLNNKGNPLSAFDRRYLQKKRVFYSLSIYNLISALRRGNALLNNVAGTYMQTYYSGKLRQNFGFLFHIDKKLTNSGKRVPLVLIIPYNVESDDFSTAGYYDLMPQINADIMLADKYGFALAWPFLDGSATNIGKMEDDVQHVMEKIESHYSIDKEKIFMIGDSEGAQRALYLAMGHPEKYRGIALFVPNWNTGDAVTSSRLKNIPILIARARDDKFPIEGTLNFIKKSELLGFTPKFVQYDGGHESMKKDQRRLGFEFFRRTLK
jgi:predicted esterase